MISTASAQSQPEETEKAGQPQAAAAAAADPLMRNNANNSSAVSSFRRREVNLARVSLYIVVIFLVCHGVRIFPNMFEMVQV